MKQQDLRGEYLPLTSKDADSKSRNKMNGMSTADAGLEMLRGQVTDIVLGTIFLSIGATACAIAAIRWRRGVRILVWWGIFSGLYGLQTLDQTPAVLAVLSFDARRQGHLQIVFLSRGQQDLRGLCGAFPVSD